MFVVFVCVFLCAYVKCVATDSGDSGERKYREPSKLNKQALFSLTRTEQQTVILVD